jgi:hypothetical protein
MVRRLFILILVEVIGLSVATVSTQDSRTVDARAALMAANKAMGGDTLKTLEYSGAGWSSMIGQTYGLNEDWPHYEVADYTRQIDYDAMWSREDYTRRQGNYSTMGRVPMPETRVTAITRGGPTAYAWDIQNGMPVPFTRLYLDGAPYGDLRQQELLLTPHGALKAALAATDATAITMPIVGASDFGLSQAGRKVTIVSFSILGGKYRMNLTINDQNLVELVDTWFANPIYGDMDYEMRYTQYRDVGGIKFPMLFHVHQGDPRLNPAHNYYEYKITSVKPNAPVTVMPVPDAVRTATIAAARVESQKLADGVWMLGGQTHNSMLVEFKDYVAVVEAPNNEARSLAVMAEVNKLVPGKQIRYLINTHHHMDHAGGLRTYLAQGTTIVTHETNKQYYLDIPFYPAPRTLQPDRFFFYNPMYWISRRPAPIQTVSGEPRGTAAWGISDANHMLQVYKVEDFSYELGDPSFRQGSHSEDMLMVFLPKEKILYNADLYSPPAQGAALPQPTAATKTLRQMIVKEKLDVGQHVPTHGRVGTNDEFMRIFASTAKTN